MKYLSSNLLMEMNSILLLYSQGKEVDTLKELSVKIDSLKHHSAPNSPSKKLKVSTLFAFKWLWAYPLMCWFLFILSHSFLEATPIRLIISLVLGFFPLKEVVNKMYMGGKKHLRTQLLVLLQVLCSSVSSGYSITKSLMLVRPVIENTFGHKSDLIKPLTELENNLNMHMSLEKALNIFADSIDFPEIAPVFNSLAISGQVGNSSLAILRSSCQMLSELNSVQGEINAQNAGKNAEAAMLCLMPFVITLSLDKMGGAYLTQARQTRTGSILLAVAFVICIIAASLLFRYMSHSDAAGFEATKNKKYKERKVTHKSLIHYVKRILPTSFITSRYELFSELSIDPEESYNEYLWKQLYTAITVFVTSILFLAVIGKSIVFAFLIMLIICFCNYYDVKRKTQLKKEAIMKDIPLFMCLICTLLEAGILLPKAIQICSKAFKGNPSLSYEINGLRAMIISGVSASDAIERMSIRIQIPEAQSALLLIARYGRLGTSEVLNLLSLQANACWNLSRNAARKKQEREALSLLLPMTLDFLCVLIVATTPAIISLGI